jgi:hypothetical protein
MRGICAESALIAGQSTPGLPGRDKMARDKRRHGEEKTTTLLRRKPIAFIGFAAEVNYAAPLNPMEIAEFD